MLKDISGAVSTPDIFYHAYLCGIGGIGISGVALLLMDRGFHVMGADLRKSEITDLLQGRGAEISFSPCPDKILSASCIIVPASFPQNHPDLIVAREHNIPILDRTHALALFCHAFVNSTTLCFGTLERGKVTRLLAMSRPDAGWCAGAVSRDGLPHARIGRHLFIDLDERDVFDQPQYIQYFPNPEIVVSDIQSPDYGYYPEGFSFQELIKRITPYLDKVSNDALPLKLEDIVYHPEEGSCEDIQIVGWFEHIPHTFHQYHEIRMHPVSIASSLNKLFKLSSGHPVTLVMKPFISTLHLYSTEIWSHIFKNVETVYIISPPYKGCTETDCIQFARALAVGPFHVEVVSLEQAHSLARDKGYWLWSGAPDIIPQL